MKPRKSKPSLCNMRNILTLLMVLGIGVFPLSSKHIPYSYIFAVAHNVIKANLQPPEQTLSDSKQTLNEDQQALNQDQQALNEGQQALNEGRQALNYKQQALNHKQQALNHKQQALNHKQQALNHKQQALNHKQQALNHDKEHNDFVSKGMSPYENDKRIVEGLNNNVTTVVEGAQKGAPKDTNAQIEGLKGIDLSVE